MDQYSGKGEGLDQLYQQWWIGSGGFDSCTRRMNVLEQFARWITGVVVGLTSWSRSQIQLVALFEDQLSGVVLEFNLWSSLWIRSVESLVHIQRGDFDGCASRVCVALGVICALDSQISLHIRLVDQFSCQISGLVCALDPWSSFCVRLVEQFSRQISGFVGVFKQQRS